MSLIYICELNAVDTRRYLTVLLEHSTNVRTEPAAWMPWNYQHALATDTS